MSKKQTKLLNEGRNWVDYDDDSGNLKNPDGKSVIRYDYTTQEYRDVHGEWQFMSNYPATTPWDQFKTDMENLIVSEGLASYNDTVNSIAVFEEELKIPMNYRLFPKDEFVDWSAYKKLAEVNNALYDLLLSRNEPDVFDLSIADKLCNNYSPRVVCSMLTDNQKELVIIGVECEQDWSNIVPPNIKLIYDEIINVQTESKNLTMQM